MLTETQTHQHTKAAYIIHIHTHKEKEKTTVIQNSCFIAFESDWSKAHYVHAGHTKILAGVTLTSRAAMTHTPAPATVSRVKDANTWTKWRILRALWQSGEQLGHWFLVIRESWFQYIAVVWSFGVILTLLLGEQAACEGQWYDTFHQGHWQRMTGAAQLFSRSLVGNGDAETSLVVYKVCANWGCTRTWFQMCEFHSTNLPTVNICMHAKSTTIQIRTGWAVWNKASICPLSRTISQHCRI